MDGPEDLQTAHDAPTDTHERAQAEQHSFRAFFDFAPDPYIITSTRGFIRLANRAACELLGTRPEQLAGKPLGVFVFGRRHSELFDFLKDVTAGQPREWRARLHTRAGVVLPVEVTAAATTGPGGEPLVQWLLRDIRPQLRAEDASRSLEVERELRAVLEATERRSQFLAAAADRMGELQHPDAAALVLAQLAASEFGDVAICDIGEASELRRFPSTDGMGSIRGAGAAILRVLQTGTAEFLTQFDARMDLGIDSGLAYPGCCALVQPLLARGRLLGVLTIIAPFEPTIESERYAVRALADRGAVALDNLQLLQAARAADRAKTEFISMMSHEFRTPLTSIAGYADLLDAQTSGPLTERQAAFVRSLRASAWHLAGLVDQVLTFSRLDTGSAISSTQVSLPALLDEVVQLFRPDSIERRIHISAQCEPLTLHTDVARLRQILINLTANALKFTERGRIELRGQGEDERVVLLVTDTGSGIAEAHLEQIFQPFWQVDQSDTRSRGGAGLGLAVCRKLAHALGGSISVRSQVGDGSTFRVELPLRLDTG